MNEKTIVKITAKERIFCNLFRRLRKAYHVKAGFYQNLILTADLIII